MKQATFGVLIFLVFQCFPGFAQSYPRQTTPARGDVARYEGTITKSGKVSKLFREVSVTEERSSASKRFYMATTEIIDGDLTVTGKYDDGISTFDVLGLLEKCSIRIGRWMYQGTVGNIKVPAGEYLSCALTWPIEGGEIKLWLADVPLGIAKYEEIMEDGSGISFELEGHQLKWSTKPLGLGFQ